MLEEGGRGAAAASVTPSQGRSGIGVPSYTALSSRCIYSLGGAFTGSSCTTPSSLHPPAGAKTMKPAAAQEYFAAI